MTTAKKAPAKKSAAKKAPAKKSAKKAAKKSAAQTCWPGYQSVPGKAPGTKGSCEPKPHQTKGEKKADSKAAAARKQEK